MAIIFNGPHCAARVGSMLYTSLPTTYCLRLRDNASTPLTAQDIGPQLTVWCITQVPLARMR